MKRYVKFFLYRILALCSLTIDCYIVLDSLDDLFVLHKSIIFAAFCLAFGVWLTTDTLNRMRRDNLL